ncbi:MAG: hypothetical protein IIC69_03415 [Nanoarchaeota archaeon]|nr:hypothetical protein [Nanoarchaeota archaeon]
MIEVSCFIQVLFSLLLGLHFIELAMPIGITSFVWLSSVFIWQEVRWHFIEERDHKIYVQELKRVTDFLIERNEKER